MGPGPQGPSHPAGALSGKANRPVAIQGSPPTALQPPGLIPETLSRPISGVRVSRPLGKVPDTKPRGRKGKERKERINSEEIEITKGAGEASLKYS